MPLSILNESTVADLVTDSPDIKAATCSSEGLHAKRQIFIAGRQWGHMMNTFI